MYVCMYVRTYNRPKTCIHTCTHMYVWPGTAHKQAARRGVSERRGGLPGEASPIGGEGCIRGGPGRAGLAGASNGPSESLPARALLEPLHSAACDWGGG